LHAAFLNNFLQLLLIYSGVLGGKKQVYGLDKH